VLVNTCLEQAPEFGLDRLPPARIVADGAARPVGEIGSS
jgi:hypothetical protein